MESIAKQLSNEQAKKYLMMNEEAFWDDIQNHTLKGIKHLLETTMEVQINDITNAARYEHTDTRQNYRNGCYKRDVLTSMGWVRDIRVPRLRKSYPLIQIMPRYKQRTKDVDKAVLEMFLSGVSTRRVGEVVRSLTGDATISHGTVSKISKQLNRLVYNFHNRTLSDNYKYLIIDAVYISSKGLSGNGKKCVLAAYAIKIDGTRELIDYELVCKGESEQVWSRFLNNLYYRGLKGTNLQLIVVDGNKGAYNAADLIYPFAKIQRCWAHKLRNVSNYLPKKLQTDCINQARNIYNAQNKQHALQEFKLWHKIWHPACPKAVRCLEKDIDDMLHFFDCPKHMHKKLRTTNAIERVFREVRRRTRPIGCFTNNQSVERIIFAILSRQNRIWQRKPLWKKMPLYKHMNIDKYSNENTYSYDCINPKFTQKF